MYLQILSHISVFFFFWVLSMQAQSYGNMFTPCKKNKNNKNKQIGLFKIKKK